MKIYYSLFFVFLLLSMILLTGCSEEEIYIFKHKTTGSSCPNNAWCEEHVYTNDIVYLDYLYTNDTIWVEYT